MTMGLGHEKCSTAAKGSLELRGRAVHGCAGPRHLRVRREHENLQTILIWTGPAH